MSQSTDTNLSGGLDPVVPGGQSPSLEFYKQHVSTLNGNPCTRDTRQKVEFPDDAFINGDLLDLRGKDALCPNALMAKLTPLMQQGLAKCNLIFEDKGTFGENDTFTEKDGKEREKGKGVNGTVTAYTDKNSGFEFVRKRMEQKKMRPEEVEVLLRLKHPSICRLLGVKFSVGFADILLEDCGTSLPEFLESLRKDSHEAENYWMHVKPMSRQGFEALLYMNGKGILHMDIKPDNCVVRSNSGGLVLVLVDFGSCIIQDKVSNLTTVQLTKEYAAPEVWAFLMKIKRDPKSALIELIKMADTYSFGLTVYYMCTLSHLLHKKALSRELFELIPKAIGRMLRCPVMPDSLLEVMKGTLQPYRNNRWSNQMAIDRLKGGSGSVGTEKDARAGTITSPASQARLSQQSSGCAMVPCTVLPADDSTTAEGVKLRNVLIKAGVETSSKDRAVDMAKPEASLSDDLDLPPSSSGSKPQHSTSRGKGGFMPPPGRTAAPNQWNQAKGHMDPPTSEAKGGVTLPPGQPATGMLEAPPPVFRGKASIIRPPDKAAPAEPSTSKMHPRSSQRKRSKVSDGELAAPANRGSPTVEAEEGSPAAKKPKPGGKGEEPESRTAKQRPTARILNPWAVDLPTL